jgi:predicted ATPase
VLLFEDVHWADPTTLEVLDLLIDRVKTVPLLVVLTHRPEFQPLWSGHGHVGALNLSKLTRAQSAAMVSTLAGKALPEPLRDPYPDRWRAAVCRGTDQGHSGVWRSEGGR